MLTGLLLVASAAPALAGAPPTLVLRSFEIRARGGPEASPIRRRIDIGVPAGWTVASPPGRPELELVGPEGEGRMLIFAGLHPSHLGPVLERLRAAHPAAAPSPPERLELPGIRGELGERATRFSITGREVGEMVLLEKEDTIILIAPVVEPGAWARLEPKLARVYPTVSVRDLEAASRPREER
jgi:hypothetical protein